MKVKITALLLSAAIMLGVGVSVAYYNTRLLGFDENAKIVDKDDEKIKILDFDFYYEDANRVIKRVAQYMPKTHYTVTLYTA